MGDTAVPDGQGAQPGTGDLPQLRAFLLTPELEELPDFELASTPSSSRGRDDTTSSPGSM